MERTPVRGNLLADLPSRIKKTILPLNLDEPLCLGISCMNCHSTIPHEEIEEHSMSCLVPIHIGEEDSVEFCSNKLRKFSSFVSSLAASPTLELADAKIIQELDSILKEVLQVKATTEEIDMYRDYLAHLDETCIGSTNIRIYIERGHSLAKEYFNAVQPTINETKGILESLKSKVRALRNPKKQDTSPNQELVQINKRKLEEINSELISRKSHLTNNFSLSSATENIQDTPTQDIETSQGSQKGFYAMCLSVKMTLEPDDPAQAVNLGTIYAEVLSKKIPEEDWLVFIKSYLNTHPKQQIKAPMVDPKKNRSKYFDEALEY